jgi:hypothetical protein
VADLRPALGPDDPTMYLRDAARLLEITSSAVRKTVTAPQPRIRGLPPRSPLNPTSQWAVSVADVESELRRRGRAIISAPPIPAPRGDMSESGLSTEDLRVQLIQGDYVDALRAQLAEKDSRIEVLERLLAEKDTRLAERDEQIVALRRRVRALADVD